MGRTRSGRLRSDNVGDVFVTAVIELDVAVRPPEPKPCAEVEGRTDDSGGDRASGDQPSATAAAAGPLPRERKTFRARSHLLVTVPLYTRWMSLDRGGPLDAPAHGAAQALSHRDRARVRSRGVVGRDPGPRSAREFDCHAFAEPAGRDAEAGSPIIRQ